MFDIRDRPKLRLFLPPFLVYFFDVTKFQFNILDSKMGYETSLKCTVWAEKKSGGCHMWSLPNAENASLNDAILHISWHRSD